MTEFFMKFCFQNFGNGREGKIGRKQATFGFANENKFFRYILL